MVRDLHQGEDALLHEGAARGGKQHERAGFSRRGLEALDHRLAGGHAERAAHEIEILRADDHGELVELAVAELNRILEAGLAACILETIEVTAFVAEFQRIGRHLRPGDTTTVSLSNIDLRRAAALIRM